MQSLRFTSFFAALVSVLVLAQSNRAPLANQANGLPIGQEQQHGMPPNLSQMPQGAPFAQRRAGAFKASALRRGASPMQSGLNFAPAMTYGSGGYDAFSVAVADGNGDGNPDLLVANDCADSSCMNGSVAVLLGNGDGTFQTAVAYPSGGQRARSVAVAGVNGDGKPDLLVTNCCGRSGTVGVLLGNGDGTFQPVVTYDSGGYTPLTVVVADVNGDGRPDLVVANAAAHGGRIIVHTRSDSHEP